MKATDDTGAATPPAWRRPPGWTSPHTPVAHGETTDLAIVGGGYLGLSTALHAVRLGLGVRLLERDRIGAGASGVNGGQVIPGLKLDPDDLLARFGMEVGRRLADFAATTADRVFDLIARESLAVPASRNGWIGAAHSEAALRRIAGRYRQWLARGAPVEMLDAAAIRRLTGAEGYVGGWLDRRAGAIDPLAYACELARIAAASGARIAEGTPALRLRREGDRWTVETPQGAVAARHVLVATNATSGDLVPGLGRSLVALHSFQIATAPLPDDLAATILPGGQPVSDSRRVVLYFRRTADGRVTLGGRGRMGVPRSPADWSHLEGALRRLYPALRDTPIERRWFGRVAMTADHLPHLHEPEPGLLAVAGCQGRGIGLMTALGERLALACAQDSREPLPLPVTPIRPIPLHAFRRAGVAATVAWFRLLDGIGL
jgi:glycine/D-amino acid oxidase-like deaminating enzyme